jgi:hypothetical protein
MEMHPTLTDEESNVSLWPWEEEVISGAEYRRSLEGLKRFVEEVEVNRLQTLEDLSAVASLVGHDVHVVAVTKGKKIENNTEHFEPTVSEPISCIEREYVFTRCIGNLEIVVTASKGHSLISRYRLLGFQRYLSEELSVRLPSDRDIAIGEKPNVDEQSMYAKDLRGARRAYHPAKEPDRSEIQQVFAHLLKDALSTLRDVVSVLA